MNDEILMVENDGLYSLPEISIESSQRNNIVDIGNDLVKRIGAKVDDLALAYVLEQKVPESNEYIITYYFVTSALNNDVEDGYEWVSKAYDKMDTAIYPTKFIESLKNKLTNGWRVTVEVIKTK